MSKPTKAFIGASYAVLLAGILTYCVGLWNSDFLLNEKGYYFTVLMYGLFAVVSTGKSVRDKAEGIPVTQIYYGFCVFSSGLSIFLLLVGLWNAEMLLSEKGFFGMTFLLSLFAITTVQKNTRDENAPNLN